MSQSNPAAEPIEAQLPHQDAHDTASERTSRVPGARHEPPWTDADVWRRVNRDMIAKALAEFAYEELLAPVPDGDGDGDGETYAVVVAGDVRYRFTARRGAYDAWHVDPASVRRTWDGGEDPAEDMLQFLLDAHSVIGMCADTAGHLVRELTATLAADAATLASAVDAATMADLGHADTQGHRSGHPWFVPNKGRVGFSASDARAFAPEARRPLHLPWIAVHRDLAVYRAVPHLTEQRLYEEELDPATIDRFRGVLTARTLDVDAYLWMPVHPWQWDEAIATLFAPDIATGRVVYLGEARDRHLPRPCVRTFSNVDRPDRRTLKLPLSVLDSLVWHGLPTERTLAAPAVTRWVQGLRDEDAFLRDECRVILLGETASVTVRHPVLEELPGVPYQYRELLGAIWREPLGPLLDPGERARPLASLLHVDPAGRPFVTELVERSQLAPRVWLRRLFHTLLPPLLHCLYRYGLVFCPDGENTIVVFDEHDVPVRLAVEDFVDNVRISDQPLPEPADPPAEIAHVVPCESPEVLCRSLHAALFVGHHRHLADIAATHLGVPQEGFWALVREEVLDHQRAFPELVERHELFDLFTPRIDRLCPNRDRLLLDGCRDRPTRPHVAVHGSTPNALCVRHGTHGGPTPAAPTDKLSGLRMV